MKKNKVYFIAPLIVLAIFYAYYWNFSSQYEQRQADAAAVEKARKLKKLQDEAASREAAIKDALEAQKLRKAERKAREEKEQKEKDAKDNARLDAEKADQEAQKLERQSEKLEKDVAAAKDEITKLESEEKNSTAELEFLDQYIAKAQANQAKLGDVMAKVAQADAAIAKQVALAAAEAAKKNYQPSLPKGTLMKKWFYVLFPSALLAIFLVFYFASKKETDAREAAHREEVAREKAEADAKKAAAEAKARDDAEKRNIERAAEEAKAAKDKEDKYFAEMAKIKEETDRANATAESFAKKVSELTIELENLRKQKDELTRQDFDMEKKIEMKEVERRAAEMEIQRYTEMLANRADQSIMGKAPIAPPPPKES